jgi:hypothetical protein
MANPKYPYHQTVVKFSYKTNMQDSRFEHHELDTQRYAITFQVPTDRGYVYNDFGYDRVQEVKAKYQYQFESQSQAIIAEMHDELEARLTALRIEVETKLAEELLEGVVASKKETA